MRISDLIINLRQILTRKGDLVITSDSGQEVETIEIVDGLRLNEKSGVSTNQEMKAVCFKLASQPIMVKQAPVDEKMEEGA